ncbi:hypothetical protein [Amycolatopsis sp. NPDC051071]|uniref:hypothetical protein n=1 Tax=Amycolatopsis sp. NPDC051071 TaxID=3154637 RepID=UPI0034394B43
MTPLANPTLPPSLQAEFRGLADRISALERGERKVTYRDRLTTNDGAVARAMFTRDGRQAIYASGMVNPKYPVLVARFMIQLFGTSAVRFNFEATLGGLTTATRTFTLRGLTSPDAYNIQVFELAWLHGMPVDEWQDTEAVSALRKCVVRYFAEATADHVLYSRPSSIHADATANGFTVPQANVLSSWVAPRENTNPVLVYEPEYTFLAPLSSYPTATAEGTLLRGTPSAAVAKQTHATTTAAPEGSSPPVLEPFEPPGPVPPLPVPVFETPDLPAPSPQEPSPFPDTVGAWPLEPRGFGY